MNYVSRSGRLAARYVNTIRRRFLARITSGLGSPPQAAWGPPPALNTGPDAQVPPRVNFFYDR